MALKTCARAHAHSLGDIVSFLQHAVSSPTGKISLLVHFAGSLSPAPLLLQQCRSFARERSQQQGNVLPPLLSLRSPTVRLSTESIRSGYGCWATGLTAPNRARLTENGASRARQRHWLFVGNPRSVCRRNCEIGGTRR